MRGFTNLTCDKEPEVIMFPQETDLLQELIQDTLERLAPHVTKGTFILDGQKFSEKAKCILRFNLSGGSFSRMLFHKFSKTSDEIAEESIDEMLAIPGVSRYVNGGRPVQYPMTNDERNMTNGPYRDGELVVLVMNATHGRFLITCHLDDNADNTTGIDAAELVLYAVAQAIANMGKEDITLQHSARYISQFALRAVNGYPLVYHYIEEAFQVGSGLAMMAWKTWHELANAKGELTLFFE